MNRFLCGAYFLYHFTNSLLTGYYLAQNIYTQCEQNKNNNELANSDPDKDHADCNYDKRVYFATGALIGFSNFILMLFLGLTFFSKKNLAIKNAIKDEISDEFELNDSGDKKLQKSIAMFLGLISSGITCNHLIYDFCNNLSRESFPDQDPRPLSIISTINIGIQLGLTNAKVAEVALINPLAKLLSQLCKKKDDIDYSRR